MLSIDNTFCGGTKCSDSHCEEDDDDFIQRMNDLHNKNTIDEDVELERNLDQNDAILEKKHQGHAKRY